MWQGGFVASIKSASDETFMRELLIPVVQERFGPHTRINGVAAKHFQRRLLRYAVQLFDAEKKSAFVWRLIGKVYGAPPQMRHGAKMMQHLLQHGFSPAADDGISMPEPVQSFPDLSLILMAEVSGLSLRQLVKEGRATPDDIRLAAAAVAKLHRCPPIAKKPFTAEDAILLCKPSPQVLAQAYPELATAIGSVVETAQAMTRHFGGQAFTLIHGDFHLGHVFVDGEKVWLLDFDQLNCGDPAYDLAEVFVFLKRTAKKKKLADYVAELKDAFIARYFSAMGWEIAGRVPLYEALLHLKRACKCYRVQDAADWEEEMHAMIEQAAVCVKAMEKDHGTLDFDKVIELYQSCPGTV